MPEGPERTPRVRLFVALELPEDRREELAHWTRTVLGGDEALRLVRANSLHVTLAFLGWRDTSAVGRIADVVAEAVDGAQAPRLVPRALLGLPSRRPRVLAVDLDDDHAGRAATVQRAVEEGLSAAGLHEPERRPYRPHVTVARVRKGRRAPTGRFPDPPARPFVAGDVVLFRSDLSPAGASYTALARTALR